MLVIPMPSRDGKNARLTEIFNIITFRRKKIRKHALWMQINWFHPRLRTEFFIIRRKSLRQKLSKKKRNLHGINQYLRRTKGIYFLSAFLRLNFFVFPSPRGIFWVVGWVTKFIFHTVCVCFIDSTIEEKRKSRDMDSRDPLRCWCRFH